MKCLSLAAHRVIFPLAISTVSLDGKLKPCRMAASKPSSVGGTRLQRFMVFNFIMLKPSREWMPCKLTYLYKLFERPKRSDCQPCGYGSKVFKIFCPWHSMVRFLTGADRMEWRKGTTITVMLTRVWRSFPT